MAQGEDQKGIEEIYLRAERDLGERINHNHSLTVGNDQTIAVDRHRTTTIGGADTTTVRGELTTTIVGSSTETVTGDRSHTVLGGSTESIRGRATCAVQEDYFLKVEGSLCTMSGKDGKGVASAYAPEAYNVGTDGTLTLIAKKRIVLECGDSSIVITPDAIKIKSKALVLSGSEAASFMGAGPALHLTDDAELVAKTVRIYSEKASLELDENASLNGKLVKLNCKKGDPSKGSTDDEAKETQALDVKLTDEEFKPFASKKYHLVVDGQKYEGETDAAGMMRETIPKAAKTAEVTIWTEEYPTGKRRHWVMSLAAELPPVDTVRGAQMRLGNVGYATGPLADELDDKTRKALRTFQADHAIEVNGELDAATIGKLGELHGH